ncbi:histone H2B-like [Acomys russatus]|uniref:histone H2B-like n=1 Tax=Acomys russatus TaxID=60746 RepID=UPI0021E2F4AA|nr:histone H2B-like [Acomys russatus]
MADATTDSVFASTLASAMAVTKAESKSRPVSPAESLASASAVNMTPVEEVSSDTSEEVVRVRKPKKASSKAEDKQSERHHRSRRRLLQRQQVNEEERRAARLVRRRKSSFAIYFPKVLKNVHEDLTLSQRAVSILDSFVKDMFERIASEARLLACRTKSPTINSREIQTAVRLLLPGKMCKRAVAKATMAMIRYISSE